MLLLTKLLSAIVLPPFNSILLWIFALIFKRFNVKWLSRCCTLLGLSLLYAFSTPFVAEKLTQAVSLSPNFTLSQYKTAQAIVVLGGGVRESQELFADYAIAATPFERMRYAAYLHKETGLPLLTTGGSPEQREPEAKVMAQEFEQFFNVKVKWLETESNTTAENARYTATILQQQGVKKIIIVTNQWHIKRATMLFEKQGFDVLPAPIGTHGALEIGFLTYIPQARALNQSSTAIKEWLGYLKEL